MLKQKQTLAQEPLPGGLEIPNLAVTKPQIFNLINYTENRCENIKLHSIIKTRMHVIIKPRQEFCNMRYHEFT